jgi:hypothetical protein
VGRLPQKDTRLPPFFRHIRLLTRHTTPPWQTQQQKTTYHTQSNALSIQRKHQTATPSTKKTQQTVLQKQKAKTEPVNERIQKSITANHHTKKKLPHFLTIDILYIRKTPAQRKVQKNGTTIA